MSEQVSDFIGDIPTHYDQGLGSVIFDDYASDISRRAEKLSPASVLELASGTGIVSRKLRNALPVTTKLTVTDLNPPMLEVARGKFSTGQNVEFQQADAMNLPFDDNSFDLVVCQFGVMFFPDKVASYKEVKRVLRPGGTYLFNAWVTNSENPFSEITQKLSEELFPDNPPGFYRVPFSYADADQVIADLDSAGLTDATAETVEFLKPIIDLDAFARGIVFGNPIYDEISNRDEGDPAMFMAHVKERFEATWGTTDPKVPLKATVYSSRA